MASPPFVLGTVSHVTCMDEYQEALKFAGDRLVVIDFGAKWCGPCRRIAPFFEELAGLHDDAVFLKVDVDEAQDVAQTLSVSTLPTFMFLRRGRTLEAFTGADNNRLRTTLERHKASAPAAAQTPTPAAAPAPIVDVAQQAPTPAPAPAPVSAAPKAAAPVGAFFQGDVAAAIASARSQSRPLLVAVEAPPPHADSARQESEVWADAAVVTALSECVALRLRADTQDARNFAQLYPVLVFPMIYLINPLTGVPFVVLPGFTPASTLLTHISTSVAALKASAAAAAPLGAAPAAVAPAGASVAPAPVAPAADSAATTTTTTTTTPPTATTDDKAPPLDVDAEKARLLKKLAEVRAAKEQAAAAEAKEKEMQRIREAKEAQKAKEASEEQRRQLALEKAAKEREEDERAKARIREQIRLDRMERAKAASTTSNAAAAAAATTAPAPVAAAAPAAPSAAAPASTSTFAATASMLQVRLLDGSLVKFDLPSTAPLSEVRSLLMAKHRLPSTFFLLTPYPRRVYTVEEERQTLKDLGLSGAVTLIVTLPDGHASSSGGGGGGGVSAAASKAQGWGSYLWSWLTWSSPAAASSSPTAATPSEQSQARSSPQQPSSGSSSRQIRTLRDNKDDDDDEERKTWNGNSTQQL